MLWEFMRMVEELQPASYIIENVPPLLTAGKGGLFKALRRRGIDLGYTVVADILDACNYGVPQRRRRTLIVGMNDELRAGRHFQFPMPTNWGIGEEPGGKAWNMTQHDFDGDDTVEFDDETQKWKQVATAINEGASESEQASLFEEVAR